MSLKQPASPTPELVGRYGTDITRMEIPMLGLAGLFDEMATQGWQARDLLVGTGLSPESINNSSVRISHHQKVLLFRNAQRLSRDPLLALRAGQRQRLCDFGVYGYALSSSQNFGQAVSLGIRHIKLAGPVLEKTFRVEGGVAILEGHEVIALGKLLPLVSEFWFSSMQTLIERILDRPFRAYRLLLPYAAPPHAAEYAKVFHCPVEFEAGVIQWQFYPALLDIPCPNANPITADLCLQFCERMLGSLDSDEPEFIKTIRLAHLSGQGRFAGADEMASRLHISKRTLHRRLVFLGVTYQDILDDVRRRLADEYLRNTMLSMDEIAERTGFSDTSNFRKAYRKWTGLSPNEYRRQQQ